eukprot:261856_1
MKAIHTNLRLISRKINTISTYSYLSRSVGNFCTQIKDTKPSEVDQPNNKQDNEFKLIYTSNYNSTVYGVKFLSFTGCITSLIVAPLIIFNPFHFSVLESISTVGRCFLGIPIAIFGVGTSYALHLFTKSIATKMYHNQQNDDVQLQFVTLYLTTITLTTNLNHMKVLDKAQNIGIANIHCTDINKKCFLNDEYLSEYVANKIGFNDDNIQQSDDDTSWMGKQ